VHRVTLNLLPQIVGFGLYNSFRDNVHYNILLHYAVTMLQMILFGTCRSFMSSTSRRLTGKKKLLFGKEKNLTIKLNV
jgi:hypothetical protein